MKNLNWICARYSKIHNIGLYTDRFIGEGEKIHFDVPEISKDSYLLLTQVLNEKDKELFLITDDRVYDVRNSLLRYLNHSDKPNIDFENGLFLFALRDIRDGEELTIDYGWEGYEWEAVKKQ